MFPFYAHFLSSCLLAVFSTPPEVNQQVLVSVQIQGMIGQPVVCLANSTLRAPNWAIYVPSILPIDCQPWCPGFTPGFLPGPIDYHFTMYIIPVDPPRPG